MVLRKVAEFTFPSKNYRISGNLANKKQCT